MMRIFSGKAMFIGCLSMLTPLMVSAEESGAVHQVGLASYATGVDYENEFIADDAFSGLALFYTGAVNNNVAFRLGLFGGDYDGDDLAFDALGLTSAGYDASILLGGNLQNTGLKGYIGLGVFSEEWEDNGGGTEEFGGAQFILGVGYNFEALALDFWLAGRDASDYEEYFGATATASSAGLMVSARF